MTDIETKLESLPSEPGIYIFFDKKGEIVYIGKAKDLRKRVKSYFTGRDDGRFFFGSIVTETANLEFIVTNNEKEAFILESTLIRENRPKFNIVFRDDKRFLSLRITVSEEFPGVYQVRGPKDDGERYIGPFDSAAALRETMNLILKVFPVRTCRKKVTGGGSRPCLKHQTGRCSAPCAGLITKDEYSKHVSDMILFLAGKKDVLTRELGERMAEASGRLEFEKAAALRDQIRAIERTVAAQHVAGADFTESDVFGFAREGDNAAVQILFVRRAGIIQARSMCFRTLMPDADLLSSVLGQYYSSEGTEIPEEVVLCFDPGCVDTLAEVLSEKKAAVVRVHVPKRGGKRVQAALASRNAWHALRQWEERSRKGLRSAADLQSALMLARSPRRIECFDISNFGGSDAVGSMACFVDGEPFKKGYMRFRIKSTATRDDPSMIAEVVGRRFARSGDRPDLVVIDGGPSQLNAAAAALDRLGLREIELVSIAKERQEGGKPAIPDRIYIPGAAEPKILPEHGMAIHLLQRVRDEAHRFAVEYHRMLRKKRTLATGLEGAAGIGPRRRKLLLREFGSLEGIRNAAVEELASVKGMGIKSAMALKEFLDKA